MLNVLRNTRTFLQKIDFNEQKRAYAKITTVTSKLLFGLFIVFYRVAKYVGEKAHRVTESLVLPAWC